MPKDLILPQPKKRGNMYPLSVSQLNLHVGCLNNCLYCRPSFQAQLKRWAKGKCVMCYQFKPHSHLERMNQTLPRTGYMQFIFLCANGDIAYCPTDVLQRIIDFIKAHQDRTFLIQSKTPNTFNRVRFPRNVILGTTIETNKVVFNEAVHFKRYKNEKVKLVRYEQISHATPPPLRINQFEQVKHQPKMVTFEPILEFDRMEMVQYADRINPCMIWLGYDSKNCKLPEPSLREVQLLHWELARRGYVVILKTIRKAWWEKPNTAWLSALNREPLPKFTPTKVEVLKPSNEDVGKSGKRD